MRVYCSLWEGTIRLEELWPDALICTRICILTASSRWCRESRVKYGTVTAIDIISFYFAVEKAVPYVARTPSFLPLE